MVLTNSGYRARKGAMCPICRSGELELVSQLENDGARIYQDVSCKDCGAQWTDVFILDRYDNLLGGNSLKFGIVGSRRYTDADRVKHLVTTLQPGDIVISGGCRGVDTWAVEQAEKQKLSTIVFEPDFTVGGDAYHDRVKAYYARNRQIVEASDVIVAFVAAVRKGGTENTIKRANGLGVPALIVEPDAGVVIDRNEVLRCMSKQKGK